MKQLPEQLTRLLAIHQLNLKYIDSDELYGEYDPSTRTVSIDKSLKGRALYLVILHEVAHYLAPKDWYIRLHGKEWQSIYKDLVLDFHYLFPTDILDSFKRFTLDKEKYLIESLNGSDSYNSGQTQV